MAHQWKSLESKNRVFCRGRCVTSNNLTVLFCSIFLITVTCGLFFGFDCPYLTKRLSPAIPVFAAVLFIFVMLFILRTACSDPGILPRSTSDEIYYNRKSLAASVTEQVMEVEMFTGQKIQMKYCPTCQIFRPPRTSHCSLCDACIANFDHHCPWVGNCIGLRNYRYFYLFLFSLSILSFYILTFNIINIVLRAQDQSNVAEAIRATPATLVEAIIAFLSILTVVGLYGYHTCLICRGETTNEDIKKTWRSTSNHTYAQNPFSRGNFLSNYISILCGPLPPSFLNLRPNIKTNDNIPLVVTTTGNTQRDPLQYNSDKVNPSNNRVWHTSKETQQSFGRKHQQHTQSDYI